MKHLGDITKINGARIPVVDCVTGGSPCPDFSVAGKRAGLAGERSGLFMEQIRIVREMRQHDRESGRTGWMVRPRYMVWENVPGAFSSGKPKGADFATVLEEIIKVCEPDATVSMCVPDDGWTKSGCYYADDGTWSIAWRVHDARFWGVPQRRKRIALVADFGGLSAPEVLFERKSLSGDFIPGEAQREEIARVVGNSADPPVRSLTGNHPAVYDARGNGDGIISPTLIGDHQNRVTDYTAITFCPEISKSLKAKGGCDFREDSHTYVAFAMDSKNYASVRRLTPLECERLQGYPDGWTDIGDWVDSRGRKRHTSDTARYKALGNSIALPFWFWLLRRISAQYERPATLGSLFDGIGGFPLCWERCNGNGTALWASEIEEFPIAVTKKRFGDD